MADSNPHIARALKTGSGNHHGKHPTPRKEATHLLSESLAHYEVGNFGKADDFAKQLVRLLQQHGVMSEGK
jgi:hypothetical protein